MEHITARAALKVDWKPTGFQLMAEADSNDRKKVSEEPREEPADARLCGCAVIALLCGYLWNSLG